MCFYVTWLNIISTLIFIIALITTLFVKYILKQIDLNNITLLTDSK